MSRKQRTVDDVFYRLCHDDRFETEQVVIGYHDRIYGNMEMPFARFTPICKGGDIPFHRLRYFRHLDRGVLYDRDSGFDGVFCSDAKVGFGVPPTTAIVAAIKEAAWNRQIVVFNAEKRMERRKQRHSKGDSQSGGGRGGVIAMSGTGGGAVRGNIDGDSNAGALQTIPVYEFVVGTWVPAIVSPPCPDRATDGATSSSTLKVVSYNVLFNHFSVDADVEATAARWARLLACVEGCEADVVALQEVTPAFASALFACPWATSFHVTASPDDLATVTPDGQLLLSRRPLAAACVHHFSAAKRVVMAEVIADGGSNNLLVSNVHLTSDYRGQKKAVRNDQLRTILHLCHNWASYWAASNGGSSACDGDNVDDSGGGKCNGVGASFHPLSSLLLDVLLVGDFNCATECEDADSFHCLGDETMFEAAPAMLGGARKWAPAVDVWRACRPGEAGYTYDPLANKLAALNSPPGSVAKPPKRCDRMLILTPTASKGGTSSWAPVSAGLLGASSDGLDDLSDHYGLWSELRRDNEQLKAAFADESSRARALVASLGPAPTMHNANSANDVQSAGDGAYHMRAQVDLILSALQRAVAASQSAPGAQAPQCALVEVGATGLGVGVQGSSDVDVVVVGPWPASTFMPRLAMALRSDDAFNFVGFSAPTESHMTAAGGMDTARHARALVRLVSAAAFVPVIKVTRICGSGEWWPSLDVQYVCCGAFAADLIAWRGDDDEAATSDNPNPSVTAARPPPVVTMFAAARMAQRHLGDLTAASASSQSVLDDSGAMVLEGITNGAALQLGIAHASAAVAASCAAATTARQQQKAAALPAVVAGSPAAVVDLIKSVAVRVKAWAKRRGVYGTSGGFPGGFAWTLMVARLLQDEVVAGMVTAAGDDATAHGSSARMRRWTTLLVAGTAQSRSLVELLVLRRFFEVFSAWPWATEHIALRSTNGGSVAGSGQTVTRGGGSGNMMALRAEAAMVVLTPTTGRNACRSTSTSTLRVLTAELARAALTMRQLRQQQQPQQQHLLLSLERAYARVASSGQREFLASREHFFVAEVSCASVAGGPGCAPSACADALGWLGSRLLALIACLERGPGGMASSGGSGGRGSGGGAATASHLRPWPSVLRFGGQHGWQPHLCEGGVRGGAFVVGAVITPAPSGGGEYRSRQGECAAFAWALEEAVLGPFRVAFGSGGPVQCHAELVRREDISPLRVKAE